MRHLARMVGGHLGRLAGACVLLAGGAGAAALAAAVTAQAAACGPATPAGTPCTLSGTLGVTAGTLNLTSPAALAWPATGTGLNHQVVDPTSAHQSYLVNDATGSGTGWHVTLSATTFSTAGALKLPDSGTFSTNGSLTDVTSSTAPSKTCLSGSTCTLPTNSIGFPVAITTTTAGTTPVSIYNAAANTGLGSITIGNVGWWLNVRGNTQAGTYTSTILMAIVSAP